MKKANEKIIKLQAEVDYYKKQLNELSGGIVSRDYKVVEMNNEIKQMQRGFALIAALNQFRPTALFGEIFDHFTEEINIQLQNDISLVLLPDINMPDYFSPTFIKGSLGAEVKVIKKEAILIDPYFLQQKSSLLVNSQTIHTQFIKLLIKRFGIPYFILTPVIVQDKVIAFLFTGRKKETILFASSRLLMYNAHALEAISGVIAALKSQEDQFYMIEKERLRISTDMHDEIGSGITHIALLSELIQTQQKGSTELKKDINIIATSARKLVQTMSEIIWALNPHNDTLENLLAYTREQAHRYFEPLEMQFEIYFPDVIPNIKLSNAERRNLYLVTIEALNNAMKHSGATSILLKVEITKTSVCFYVTDNGIGMKEESNKHSSNGIRNIKKRMNDIGGSIDWLPEERGLTVKYCLAV